MTEPFQFFIFDYTSPASGGLGGFLAFLLAYVCAQIVNYIVQRKLVFGATIDISKTIGWYILTVVVAGIISVALPGYLVPVLTPYLGGFSATVANVVNIVLQVAINYPMMKFEMCIRDSTRTAWSTSASCPGGCSTPRSCSAWATWSPSGSLTWMRRKSASA